MIETIIYFRLNNAEKPVLKIADDGKTQVVLNFLTSNQEHLTLHLLNDGTILRNHWYKYKPQGIWDSTTRQVAEGLFKDPKKHEKYYVHNVVGHVSDTDPLHLVGRLLYLYNAPDDKPKYKQLNKLVFQIPSEKVMIHFYLSQNDVLKDCLGHFRISLGNIVLVKAQLELPT